MLFIAHGRVFPVIEKLAGQLGTLGTSLISFLADRTVVDWTAIYAEVFYIEGFSATILAAVSAFFFQVALVTIDPAW